MWACDLFLQSNSKWEGQSEKDKMGLQDENNSPTEMFL